MKLFFKRNYFSIARNISSFYYKTIINENKIHYFKELNCLYIPIPKTANTSIKAQFASKLKIAYDKKDYNSLHKVSWNYITNRVLDRYRCDDYFKFAFVRNPFDRIVSCYKNKIIQEKHSIQTLYFGYFKRNMDFATFVKRVASIPDLLSEGHFKSQYLFVFHRNKQLVDFVGKFENIQSDWEVVKNELGLSDLPQLNKSDNSDYMKYYTKELARIVAKRYAKDIELFGYTKQYQELLKR